MNRTRNICNHFNYLDTVLTGLVLSFMGILFFLSVVMSEMLNNVDLVLLHLLDFSNYS